MTARLRCASSCRASERPDLTGGVRYFDGLTNDARLVIDTLRSAARHGAIVLQLHAVRGCSRRPRGMAVPLSRRAGGSRVSSVRSNAWSTRPVLGRPLPHSRVRLRLTKGVHLVIDRRRLPLPERVVMADGKRILFAIPWGQRVILGTTDTDYEGRPRRRATEPADVAYILEVVNGLSLRPRLSADVLRTWAGLRPLIAARHGGPSDISARPSDPPCPSPAGSTWPAAS